MSDRVSRAGRRSRIRGHVSPVAAQTLERRALLSAGDLDPSFGGDGRVLPDFFPPGFSPAVAADAQNRVLLAATLSDPAHPGTPWGVARLLNDGSPDPAFGANGLSLVNLPGAEKHPMAVAPTPDGGVLTAGFVYGQLSMEIGLTKHRANGQLDTAFGGGDGIATVPVGTSAVVPFDLLPLPGGKFLVAGLRGSSMSVGTDSLVARFNADGTLDTTFGPAGTGLAVLDLGTSDRFFSVSLDGAGRIVAAGTDTESALSCNLTVARLTPSGLVDASFGGGDGVVRVPGVRAPTGAAVALPDGRVVATYGTDTQVRLTALRLTASGDLDPTFGPNGDGRTDSADMPQLSNIQRTYPLLQPDGKVVIGHTTGAPDNTAPYVRYAATRLLPDGRPDLDFGDNGVATGAPAPAGDGQAEYSLALQPDGNLVAAGSLSDFGGVGLVRFLGAGTPIQAQFDLAGGVLTVTGTERSDPVRIERPLGSDTFTVTARLLTRTFAAEGVTRIDVIGRAGNDTLTIGPDVGIPVTFDGGEWQFDTLVLQGTGAPDAFTLEGHRIIGAGSEATYTNTVETPRVVALGGDDAVAVGALDVPTFVDLGDGNDTLTTVGDRGTVEVHGQDGDDTVTADRTTFTIGFDVWVIFDGGPGTDTARLLGVSGRDVVEANFNEIQANHTWIRHSNVDAMEVFGRGGDDWLTVTAPQPVLLDGGDGNDLLDSGQGFPGRTFRGGPGDDRFTARDGAVTDIDGGPGNDFARADPDDSITDVETTGGGGVRGSFYLDANLNGRRDGDEPTVPGGFAFFDLNDGGGYTNGEPTALVNNAGEFFLPGSPLDPRTLPTVTVGATPPSGYAPVSPASGLITIPMPTNLDTTGVDFGLRALPATVSGRLFNSLNGSGTYRAGDPPLADWTIFYDADGDGVLDPGEPSTLSRADGTYSLQNVPAGSRTIRTVVQPGWRPTIAGSDARTLQLSAGGSTPGINFGMTALPAVITGAVFNDLDGDGQRDPGEPLVPSRALFLDRNGNGAYDLNEELNIPTTDPNGAYTLSLSARTFTYGLKPIPGWVTTFPADNNGVRTLTVANGQQVSGADFGVRQVKPAGTVRGTVFRDTDHDGVRDAGEAGLGLGVVYSDLNGNGARDTGEPAVLPTVGGEYSLAVLANEPQTIRLDLPDSNYFLTFPAAADHSYPITVGTNQSVTGKDFGLALGAGVTGAVYDDRNGNGRRDNGEPGLAGFRVEIRDSTNSFPGPLLRTVTTDADGNYAALGLPVFPTTFPAPTARVTATPIMPPGWALSGSGSITGNINTTGQTYDRLDFGAAQGSIVSGIVYVDSDRSGAFNTTDGRLAGWTVFADANDNGQVDAGEKQTTTDFAGSYQFGPLPPGSYVVRTLGAAGYVPFTPPSGTYPLQLTDPRRVGAQFGFVPAPPVTVAGRLVLDNDTAARKQALLPGQVPSGTNVTGSVRGITGVAVDLAGLNAALTPTAADFAFDVLSGGTWVPAAATAATVRRGAGAGGSDRVTLTLPDGSVRNAWLRVTVRSTSNTGLAAPDVFYFGNLVGDTGFDRGSPTVNATDLARTRAAVDRTDPASLEAYDFNRDGKINAADVLVVRNNQRHSLPLFTAAAAAPAAISEVNLPAPPRAPTRPPRRGVLDPPESPLPA